MNRQYHTCQPMVDLDRTMEQANEFQDSIDWNINSDENARFARLLKENVYNHIDEAKLGCSLDSYANTVLDALWNADKSVYETVDGTTYYHELPKHYTKSGNPIVVSL